MSQDFLEFSGKTLDDAIMAACEAYSVPGDRLEYEAVDQGSAGFLGFNAKDAKIRARVKDVEKMTSSRAEKPQGDVLTQKAPKFDAPVRRDAVYSPEADASSEARYEKYAREFGTGENYNPKAAKKNANGRKNRRDDRSLHVKKAGYGDFTKGADIDDVPAPTPEKKKEHEEPKVHYTKEQIDAFSKKGVDFLTAMFEAMKMQVTITTSFDEKENILTINFDGDDMGALIGKRGATLDSIQYLASLVINKGIPGYVHVKTDTENYRARRKKTLENLARNCAGKVKRTHHAVSLEPMNPYERRIIHSALQNDRYVTTYSTGEDPDRRVVIAPKR